MFLTDLIAALVITLALGALFLWGAGRHNPWGGFFWFFTVLFLFTWAAGAWTGPYGPPVAGFYWVPFLIWGILFLLILSALFPHRRTDIKFQTETERKEVPEVETPRAVAANVFLFFFLALLVIVLLAYYL